MLENDTDKLSSPSRPAESDAGPHLKEFFGWKEATPVEIAAMSPEQLKAYLVDLSRKVNSIYDVLMFPVENGRSPTADEVNALLNPNALAGEEEIDRFVGGDPPTHQP